MNVNITNNGFNKNMYIVQIVLIYSDVLPDLFFLIYKIDSNKGTQNVPCGTAMIPVDGDIFLSDISDCGEHLYFLF